MAPQQKIEFRKERDFSSTLGDSLKFLKQNFKPFFGSIILIVGPIILITSIAYAYMQASILSSTQNKISPFSGDYFLNLGTTFFLSMLSNILLSAVVYNYMGLYYEKSFGEQITISEVGKRVWNNIGRLIASVVTFTLVAVLIFFVIALICIGIGSFMGIGGAIVMGLLIFFAVAILAPVLLYMVPAGFFVVVRDEVFIFTALGKVKRYLSGNFWWTWLIMVVAFIGLGILQTIFNLPATVMVIMSTFSRIREVSEGVDTSGSSPIWLIVFYTLGMFLSTCTYSISHLICAFNFMSHEEKHEGQGLLSRIDEIK
jgi:hypothetical protein